MAAKTKMPTMTIPIQAETVGLYPKIRIAPPLPCLTQSRIDQNGQNVRDRVENDEGAREDQAAGLHDRQIALRHAVDHELPDAGIDEHGLDHHHADDEIGE